MLKTLMGNPLMLGVKGDSFVRCLLQLSCACVTSRLVHKISIGRAGRSTLQYNPTYRGVGKLGMHVGKGCWVREWCCVLPAGSGSFSIESFWFGGNLFGRVRA